MTNIENSLLTTKIAFSLEKIMQVQRILLWEIAKKEKLSPIQIQILIFLDTHNELIRTVSALADEFDLTKATISDAVSSLVSKKIIKKVAIKHDRRSHTLELTPTGKKLLNKISTWPDILNRNIDSFPEKEKEQVLSFLTELIKSLFNQKIISTARMCLTCGNIITEVNGVQFQCGLTGRNFTHEEINIDCNHYKKMAEGTPPAADLHQ
jgi:DNA-binding MarR family transcriptional regulator